MEHWQGWQNFPIGFKIEKKDAAIWHTAVAQRNRSRNMSYSCRCFFLIGNVRMNLPARRPFPIVDRDLPKGTTLRRRNDMVRTAGEEEKTSGDESTRTEAEIAAEGCRGLVANERSMTLEGRSLVKGTGIRQVGDASTQRESVASGRVEPSPRGWEEDIWEGWRGRLKRTKATTLPKWELDEGRCNRLPALGDNGGRGAKTAEERRERITVTREEASGSGVVAGDAFGEERDTEMLEV